MRDEQSAAENVQGFFSPDVSLELVPPFWGQGCCILVCCRSPMTHAGRQKRVVVVFKTRDDKEPGQKPSWKSVFEERTCPFYFVE